MTDKDQGCQKELNKCISEGRVVSLGNFNDAQGDFDQMLSSTKKVSKSKKASTSTDQCLSDSEISVDTEIFVPSEEIQPHGNPVMLAERYFDYYYDPTTRLLRDSVLKQNQTQNADINVEKQTNEIDSGKITKKTEQNPKYTASLCDMRAFDNQNETNSFRNIPHLNNVASIESNQSVNFDGNINTQLSDEKCGILERFLEDVLKNPPAVFLETLAEYSVDESEKPTHAEGNISLERSLNEHVEELTPPPSEFIDCFSYEGPSTGYCSDVTNSSASKPSKGRPKGSTQKAPAAIMRLFAHNKHTTNDMPSQESRRKSSSQRDRNKSRAFKTRRIGNSLKGTKNPPLPYDLLPVEPRHRSLKSRIEEKFSRDQSRGSKVTTAADVESQDHSTHYSVDTTPSQEQHTISEPSADVMNVTPSRGTRGRGRWKAALHRLNPHNTPSTYDEPPQGKRQRKPTDKIMYYSHKVSCY